MAYGLSTDPKLDIGLIYGYTVISIGWLMWVKQCHKPSMIENDKSIPHKNCDLGNG